MNAEAAELPSTVPVISIDSTISDLRSHKAAQNGQKSKILRVIISKAMTIPRAITLCVKKNWRSRLCSELFNAILFVKTRNSDLEKYFLRKQIRNLKIWVKHYTTDFSEAEDKGQVTRESKGV